MYSDIVASQRIQNKVIFDSICSRYFLGHVIDFITHCNTGKDRPYHNTFHCFEVMRIAHTIASVEFSLTYDEMRGLLIGCLMHDFDHTGADVPDEVNVLMSLRGLDKLVRAGDIDNVLISQTEYDIAKSCIEVTEFPFTKRPASIPECIIRDADLVYATSSLNHIEVMHNLHTEVKRKHGNESLSFGEFVKKNTPFLDSCEWFTLTGEAMYKALRGHIIKFQSTYLNLP